MPSGDFAIGEAARRSGVKVPTIRYYEQIGLLPAASRSEGNRRLYDRRDLDRLAFIRHARELGFEVEAIRTLLSLQDDPEQPCAAADAIARSRLIEVEKRIASLNALRDELLRMVEQCANGRVGDCRVIETLADTSHAHGRLAEA
ncbi:MAG: helix-turn-helix domain-containing protein [Alphaproteobacteria bacterium]|nr:helix-turn-helix domain-containing protein [Alphaproteobacteria bacterium]